MKSLINLILGHRLAACARLAPQLEACNAEARACRQSLDDIKVRTARLTAEIADLKRWAATIK